MTQRRRLAILILTVAVVATMVAVRRIQSAAAAPAGMVVVEWQGAFDGKATLPAQLAWCPITRLGTLEAISTDTGVLFSLRERDSLTVGHHPIVTAAEDSTADNPTRPAAVAAMRWVLDSATIGGFRGVSGALDIATLDSTASGRFDVQMVRAGATDTIQVRGEFKGVPMVVSAIGCT
ncbi:MAG: hypothetical protein U0974_14760 [Gemmatimonadales bacterium]|nr:hypothetical protein [Gemmatimonadales bacterium]MDZ4390979.1 hypothetical protein [Gemmatimonadales bacterium]